MTDLITRSMGQQFMPALSIMESVARRDAMVAFVRECMKDGVDYGVIPGTKEKTLLKPGAEKLLTLFGLTPRFVVAEMEKDWTGREHGGEPFFYYLYRCQLWRGDALMAEADGSSNSWEKKHRYRRSERICPECKQPAIIRGKAEYGGGWVCFKNKGGCNAKWPEGTAVIENQEVGQVANPDPADVVNTVQKIAQKRSLVCACLLAVNASEFFTQDQDDLVPSADTHEGAETASATPASRSASARPAASAASGNRPQRQASPARTQTGRPPTVHNTDPVSTPEAPVSTPEPSSSAVSDEDNTDYQALFMEKAQSHGVRRGVAKLAEMLLARVIGPEEWEQATWRDALRKPENVWEDAVAALLKDVPQGRPPAPAPVAAPAPTETDPLADEAAEAAAGNQSPY